MYREGGHHYAASPLSDPVPPTPPRRRGEVMLFMLTHTSGVPQQAACRLLRPYHLERVRPTNAGVHRFVYLMS